MQIKIFTMTHKKFAQPEDSIYVPLHVGRALAGDLGYQGDDTGDSISRWNNYYGELTGVYWVWKNEMQADVIGICHYRRFFLNEQRQLLNQQEYENILKDYDIIVSNEVQADTNYLDYFGEAHNVKDLLTVGEVIEEKYPQYAPYFQAAMKGNTYYYGNLMVTSRKLFNAYAEWLFDILFEVEQRIDVESYDLYNQRVFGFLSEQMIKIWANKNHLRIYEGTVGITAEKAETVELKLAMTQLVKMEQIEQARQMFYEYLKLRPDVRLELSDIRGEIPIIEQLLYIAQEEQQRDLPGLVQMSNDLNEWIAHYRKVLDCLSRFSQGKKTPEDVDYILQKQVSWVMGKVMLMNAAQGTISDSSQALQVLEEIYQSAETKATVVIVTYNQKESLLRCLEWLGQVSGIANIVIVDNGSTDGTCELLADIGHEYIYCDEGIQGYGKVWNAAIANFQMQEVIVFMEPQYLPGKECILRLSAALRREKCALAAPMSNGCKFYQNVRIDSLNYLEQLEHTADGNTTFQHLGIEHGIWALSKEAWTENGGFEENLLEPRNVLTDYKFRLVQKGCQLVICRHAFAYHTSCGSLEPYFKVFLGKGDKEALREKWGMNYLNLLPNSNLADMITEEQKTPVRVLEIGCDLGVTLLEIKNRYPNSELYGLEINKSAAAIASHLAEVEVGNIEDKELPFAGTFDYILFGDVLEHLHNPQEVIRFCREKLSEDGCILASVPNLMNISVMKQLLSGRFQYEDTGLLDRSHIHFFTYYQIMQMFEEEGFTVEDVRAIEPPLAKEDEQLVQKLLQLSTNVDSHMYQAVQYIVKARRQQN